MGTALRETVGRGRDNVLCHNLVYFNFFNFFTFFTNFTLAFLCSLVFVTL